MAEAILLKGGGGGVGSDEVTASKTQVLAGYTALTSDSNDEIVEGTMPNNGAVAPSALNAGGSYTIPEGYHNGSGKVTANSLANQTSATATAAQILTGKTAWVNGSQITGSMTDRGAVAPSALGAGSSYTIPAGYHNGSGKVTVQSLATMTASGDATAAQILTGKKAYVDGSLLTGTMANQGAKTATYTPSTAVQTYTIPAGYHNGSGKITINAVPSTYISVSNAYFFKNGVFGALNNLGFTSETPTMSRTRDTAKTGTWDGTFLQNTSTNMVWQVPAMDTIDENGRLVLWWTNGYNSNSKNYYHRIGFRTPVDLTNISKIHFDFQPNNSNVETLFWALSTTTNKYSNYWVQYLTNGVYDLDVSMLSGPCVFGFMRISGRTDSVYLRVNEISLQV